ncbi:MAG: DUF192 domain-containing protein [Cyanobacteria bacterium P01_F01_bin.42]
MFYGKPNRGAGRKTLAAIAGVAVLVLGCQVSGVGSQSLVDQGLPQYLPVGATALIHDNQVALEVAATPEQQALGLMHRPDLGDDRGMLFPFEPPRPAAFWMKNTLMALDIVFLREQQVVTIHADVPPCKTPTCPTYPSNGPVDQVIELEAGQAQRLGVAVGDRIEVQFLAPR